MAENLPKRVTQVLFFSFFKMRSLNENKVKTAYSHE